MLLHDEDHFDKSTVVERSWNLTVRSLVKTLAKNTQRTYVNTQHESQKKQGFFKVVIKKLLTKIQFK